MQHLVISAAQSSMRVTRNKRSVDYYALQHPKLPRVQRITPAKNKLYAIEVMCSKMEESGELHLVHYVGYSHQWDEWKRDDEIVTMNRGNKKLQKCQKRRIQ